MKILARKMGESLFLTALEGAQIRAEPYSIHLEDHVFRSTRSNLITRINWVYTMYSFTGFRMPVEWRLYFSGPASGAGETLFVGLYRGALLIAFRRHSVSIAFWCTYILGRQIIYIMHGVSGAESGPRGEIAVHERTWKVEVSDVLCVQFSWEGNLNA